MASRQETCRLECTGRGPAAARRPWADVIKTGDVPPRMHGSSPRFMAPYLDCIKTGDVPPRMHGRSGPKPWMGRPHHIKTGDVPPRMHGGCRASIQIGFAWEIKTGDVPPRMHGVAKGERPARAYALLRQATCRLECTGEASGRTSGSASGYQDRRRASFNARGNIQRHPSLRHDTSRQVTRRLQRAGHRPNRHAGGLPWIKTGDVPPSKHGNAKARAAGKPREV